MFLPDLLTRLEPRRIVRSPGFSRVENRTAADGSDLGPRLAQLFAVLNSPGERGQKNLDEELQTFPGVNGELFGEQLGFAEFNRDVRNALLGCTRFDWSRISPAIFGSRFQSVMEPKERRQIGGHHAAEHNILKVIRSLFLDALRAEFETITGRTSAGESGGAPASSPAYDVRMSKAGGGAGAPVPGKGQPVATGMKRKRRLKSHAKLCRLRFLDPPAAAATFSSSPTANCGGGSWKSFANSLAASGR